MKKKGTPYLFTINYIDPDGVIRRIADQKKTKSHCNLCSISACFQLRVLCGGGCGSGGG
jgi:hypothetical protein